ncbi:hypothetical protein [Thalassobacillus hwangdonensis]|uniref:YrzO family protein n=1 Tax=Thalassobacillus hwangdonensis TaxID=546108 RepID=A0ABW3L2A2_9BACI
MEIIIIGVLVVTFLSIDGNLRKIREQNKEMIELLKKNGEG